MAKDFVRKKGRGTVKNLKGPDEALYLLFTGVEIVTKFSYVGDRLNATGGCKAAVTAKTRIGWIKFREYSEILKGKKFSIKMKRKIYKSCVRSTLLY